MNIVVQPAAGPSRIGSDSHNMQAQPDQVPARRYFLDNELTPVLKDAARNNDAEAIDYLFTLACESGSEKTANRNLEAASFLLDLFNGKEPGDAALPRQLTEDSLRLFEIVSARNAEQGKRGITDDNWVIPTSVLKMAASGANPESQLRNDIVDQIRKQEPSTATATACSDEDVVDAGRSRPPQDVQDARDAAKPAPTVAAINLIKPGVTGLTAAASEGDFQALQSLIALACGPGVGKSTQSNAARSVFDLWRNNSGHWAMAHKIEHACYDEYQFIKAKGLSITNPEELPAIPAPILLLAAVCPRAEPADYDDIANRLRHQEQFFSEQLAEKGQINAALFSTNRFVTASELDALAGHLNRDHDTCEVLRATQITEAEILKGIQGSALSLFTKNERKPSAPPMQLMPLLFREHWVLFGMQDNKDGSRSAFVFDSLDYLSRNEVLHLTKWALYSGARGLSEIGSRTLQDHAPNACGLFVANAIQRLAGNPPDAAAQLRLFVNDFRTLSPEQQRLWNRDSRMDLLASLQDACERKEAQLVV